jgi:hypothetical protein
MSAIHLTVLSLLGQVPAEAGPDWIALVQVLMTAVNSKNWFLLCAVLLVALVGAVKSGLGNRIPFLKTKVGGWLTLFVGALAPLAFAKAAAGQSFTWTWFLTAAGAAFAAAGAYEGLHDLAKHALPYLSGKVGAVLMFFVTILPKVVEFLKTTFGAKQIEQAEAAGDKAAAGVTDVDKAAAELGK